MTTDLALEYIARRMLEISCDSFHIRFRHFQLQPGEQRFLNLSNHIFILVNCPEDVRVESDTGVFDQSENLANELQHEHQGNAKIVNYSIFLNSVQFIQVIPD